MIRATIIPLVATSGFIGYTQATQPWVIQPVSILSVYGLDLVMMLVNFALAQGAMAWFDHTWQPADVVALKGKGTRTWLLAALGAALALSVHYLITDRQMRVPEPRDAVSLTMWGFGFAALFWVVVQPWWSFPWADFVGVSDPSLGPIIGNRPIWFLSTWMVILGTAVPFWLVVAAMRHLRASQASVVGLIEPLLAILIAWVVLGEALSAPQLLGGVFIVIGVVLAERSRTRG